MGQCYGKTVAGDRKIVGGDNHPRSPLPASELPNVPSVTTTPARSTATSTWPSPYPHGGTSPLPAGASPSPSRSTPRRFFKPPSPAKHIKASLAKRFGSSKQKAGQGTIPEDGREVGQQLDKNFGFGKNFEAKYELGKEIGKGHFGHTCFATCKKGELKDHAVAVKIISKAKVKFHIILYASCLFDMVHWCFSL